MFVYWFGLAKLTHGLEIVSTTTGLFFCSFPLENCHFPQPLETSCLIDLSVLCIGPWLGQFVTLILNLDFFFFFHGNMPRNKSFLERLSNSVLQARHECSFTLRTASHRQKYQQEQVSISQQNMSHIS